MVSTLRRVDQRMLVCNLFLLLDVVLPLAATVLASTCEPGTGARLGALLLRGGHDRRRHLLRCPAIGGPPPTAPSAQQDAGQDVDAGPADQ